MCETVGPVALHMFRWCAGGVVRNAAFVVQYANRGYSPEHHGGKPVTKLLKPNTRTSVSQTQL